ncbi:MAG TPA: ATP-binding protein [Chitinophagales bacterium]|nr:ATP-binding protein [Chitinophagales bacterium]HMW12354.1 ATP-binding protein [Chitinophagales bacterium]HMX59963.1 ATP-binding protein [Chitinophagales bacterium]HMY22301.1 ATP-binding protein [Chitinophagales bacterium]HNA38373.1 ATP-binding protein [Chitinophagales bacterium]
MTSKFKIKASSLSDDEVRELYAKAAVCKQEKNYIDALDFYNKIIDYKNSEECVECAKVYEDIGDIYFELKDFQKAFENLEKALHIYADNEEYELQLNQYKKIGSLQQGIWQFKKAIEIFHHGLSLATRLDKKEKVLEFELLLGNVFNWADQLEDAEQYLVSAIEKEKRINSPLIKLRAHVSYAILLRKMKQFQKSETYFKMGIQLSSENNNAYMMDITKSYGVLKYETGHYEHAEELLVKAEKSAEFEGNDATRAVIFEYLAMLYEYKKDYEKAYHYINKFYGRKLELLEKGYSDDNNILQAKIGLETAKRERVIAEETAKAKSLFIATISHEIRTPMNIILGTAALMLNDSPKPAHLKYLQTLKKSGENLLGIINDILDVSKIEAGKLEVEYEPVELSTLFDEIISILEQTAHEKQLSLSYTVDEKINFAIMSDPLRLTQIITNLISNAIKFTAQGSVHLSATLLPNDKLQIVVRDTGMGIPKDKLKTIFDQYEQVRTKVQKKYKGTGLGLAIAKKLVEMMQGNIEIKSKINIGTSFIITLPIEKAAIQQKVDIATLKRDAAFLSDKVIVIVDDVEDNRTVIRETLKFFNPAVVTHEAADGQQALDLLLQLTNVHLVIMDLDMPVLNGFEALSAIRKHKKIKKLKVLASTASLITTSDDEFIEFGFDAYLPKPFEIDSFFLLLEKFLQ